MSCRFGRRLILAAFSFLAVGAVLSAAEPPTPGGKDTLDDARRRDQVAQQKAEADFRAAVLEVNKLEDANPARAVERYKKMLAVLDEDTTLSPAKREAWKRVLKDRIRVAENEADQAKKDAANTAGQQASKDERQRIEDEKAREEQRLQDDLKTIKRLQDAGRGEDARRLAGELAGRYPDSPAAVAARQTTGMAERIKQYRLVKSQKEEGWTLATLDVERSSIVPKDPDYNFPSPEKWREITKMRTKSQVTEREKAILQALDTVVTVNLEGSTFEAALDYLQTLTGQTIVVDKATLDAAGINYDTPIKSKVRKVTVRTLLHQVLGQVGLTYIVEKETIHVVTPEKARETMTVRTYYLGDLAGVADVQLGPIFSGVVMAQRVREIISMIVGSIEPDSWQVNNPEAKGTITFDPVTLKLIVKQSAEVHYMLGGGNR
jgi:hypothetical protein